MNPMNIFTRLIIVFLSCATVLYSEESEKPSNIGSGSRFGLGLSLFGPTGITGKYKIDTKLAVEGSMGLGTIGNGRTHVHGVLLYNFYEINPSSNFYIGAGGVFQERRNEGRGKGLGNLFRNNEGYESSFGARFPVGYSWMNENSKFELSAELYLQAFVIGKNGGDLGLNLAGRYYF